MHLPISEHFLTCASRAPLKHLSPEVKVLWPSQDLACALTPSPVFFLLNHKGRLKQTGPLPEQFLAGTYDSGTSPQASIDEGTCLFQIIDALPSEVGGSHSQTEVLRGLP